MLCPVCQVTLNMTERQGVEIDYCPKCRGVWLDRGELDKIIEKSADSAPETPRQPSLPSAPPAAPPQPPVPGGTVPPVWGGGQYQPDPDSDYDYRGKHPGHYRGHYPKKRKSFLGELFDFD